MYKTLRKRRRCGFTLIEVMVGTIVFTIAVLCGVVCFMYGQVSINNATRYRLAVEMARAKVEELEAYPYVNIASATEVNLALSGATATRTTTVTQQTLNSTTYKQISVVVQWPAAKPTQNVSVYTLIGAP
jgi:prepilin-type N-terminal cleavage/methylation domain-containing protein